MRKIEEQREKINQLAKDVMTLSRNTLVVNLRFLNLAINRLPCFPSEEVEGVATDGEKIVYSPVSVLQSYRKGREHPVRQYLHMILHCVFQHFFVGKMSSERRAWDVACDIAVENIINELNLSCVATGESARQQEVVQKLQKKVKYMTAEVIYHYLRDAKLSDGQWEHLHALFHRDNHDIWYAFERNKIPASIFPDDGNADVFKKIAQDWGKISKKMQMDLHAFGKMHGNQSGSLEQNLQEVNREKYDYSSFLRKFAVLGEAMKVNEDEFDMVFYTYGMNLYGKMPLIEPLEYKEVKRIKEFVIAIDTSGSTSGKLVQAFVQKTYNILKQEESFFTKINLHIIQCDAQIQEHIKITTQQEFDSYIKNMKILGHGGTDFRPVFACVDELIRQKEFQNLKGLIYFTDGYGTFPKKPPLYHTVAVFVEDGFEEPEVPAWVIKLVLRESEIE